MLSSPRGATGLRDGSLQDAGVKVQFNVMKKWLVEVFEDTHSCLGR